MEGESFVCIDWAEGGNWNAQLQKNKLLSASER